MVSVAVEDIGWLISSRVSSLCRFFYVFGASNGEIPLDRQADSEHKPVSFLFAAPWFRRDSASCSLQGFIQAAVFF
jgi:hypothetical protein